MSARRHAAAWRRNFTLYPMLGAMLLSACAAPQKPAYTPKPVPAPAVADYSAQITALRTDMLREVPGDTSDDKAGAANWIANTQTTLSASPYKITSPQLVLAVDRNPDVQQLRVIFATPDGPWVIIGGGKVSTGRAGRHGYFITPAGVFPHTDGILDYRALGTYNENHIRGLGTKGSRVWDFGWQEAVEGWQPDVTSEIRFLVHATDPDVLEPRLGRPDSKGCVRISAAMDGFLDRHAVLDADYLHDAQDDPAAAAILSPDLVPNPLAGRYLIVFDSSTTPR